MKNKFEAFILGSYLDTIGFLNGYMEFNQFLKPIDNIQGEYLNYINIMNFFKMGGFNLNLKLYKSSDDTIFNIANGLVIVKDKFKIEDFIDSYLNFFDTLIYENRGLGLKLTKSMKNLKKFRSSNLEYDESALGNGAVMRSCIFGLKYNYKKNLDDIYYWVIETSKLTHNNINAYISSLIVALLTSMSIEKIVPFYWIDELNKIKDKIKFRNKKEIEIFNMILGNLEIIKNDLVIFNVDSTVDKYNKPLFDLSKLTKVVNVDENYENVHNIGGLSEDLIYISYLMLLNCISIKNSKIKKIKNLKVKDIEYNFIFLVLNSSLSFGDSDTLGIVCGFWYGGLFGLKDVPKINFKDLEYYDKIKYICDRI